MANVIQPMEKPVKPREASGDDRSFSKMGHDEKLSHLYQEHRCEDRNGRIALNRTHFTTSLYYQGKQRVEWNPVTSSLDFYEPLAGEDFYVENQFRKDVNANVATMCRNEMTPAARPSSDKPDDVAAARTAESALDVIHEDVKIDRVKVRKNLNLCLYGNAFVYNGFGYDAKNGKTIIPKFKYEEVELPGMAICPECGNTSPEAQLQVAGPQLCTKCGSPMEQIASETVETKIEDGVEEKTNGRNYSIVTGPLEMYMRSKVADGLDYQPYLFWVRRLDADIVRHFRPQADLTDGGVTGADTDLSQYYIDVLSTLTGGPLEGVYTTTGARYYKEAEYAMCWIRPEAFKGDKELLKKYPDGVKFEVCNGNYIDKTAENQSMDDCWTQYVYLVNPYSAWGDGMVDAIPVQDEINETGSLMVRHLRYSTMGKKLFDPDMIVPEFLSNNPEEAWIPAQRQVEKKLSDAVFSLDPVPLSANVPQWRQMQLQTMQDMTRAYNSVVGKSSGANVPYSADVFQAEQAMGQFLPTILYNRASVIQCTRQRLDMFRDHSTEERVRKFKDNTGKWSYEKFAGADLAKGSFDIYIADSDTAPKSKAEKVKGVEMFTAVAPFMPLLSQKQKVYVLDLCGMPPDANPDTLYSQKAYRDIEAIVKRGEDVIPNPFILDIPVYVKTIKEYLADESGDELAAENPDAFVKVFTLMIQVQTQGQQMMAQMPPMGPNDPSAAQPAPQQQGTPKAPPKPEKAQSNQVPDDMKQEMPALPPGARQG